MKVQSTLLTLLSLLVLSVCSSCTPDDPYSDNLNALLVGKWTFIQNSYLDPYVTYRFDADGTGQVQEQDASALSSSIDIRAFTYDYDGQLLTLQYAEGDGHRFICAVSNNLMTLTPTAYIYPDGHVESLTGQSLRTFSRQ